MYITPFKFYLQIKNIQNIISLPLHSSALLCIGLIYNFPKQCIDVCGCFMSEPQVALTLLQGSAQIHSDDSSRESCNFILKQKVKSQFCILIDLRQQLNYKGSTQRGCIFTPLSHGNTHKTNSVLNRGKSLNCGTTGCPFSDSTFRAVAFAIFNCGRMWALAVIPLFAGLMFKEDMQFELLQSSSIWNWTSGGKQNVRRQRSSWYASFHTPILYFVPQKNRGSLYGKTEILRLFNLQGISYQLQTVLHHRFEYLQFKFWKKMAWHGQDRRQDNPLLHL